MAARLAIAFVCSLTATFPVSAATVDVHAGRLLDPDSGKVLTDQRVRIVDGRIASVGPWVGEPAGNAIVDWSN